MKHRIFTISILFLVISKVTSLAQSNEFIFNGLGVEIGGEQNNLFWSAPFNIRTPGGVATDRTNFSIGINIRINYRAYHTNSFVILPFIGYSQFGGSSDVDKYSFDAIEFGSFALFSISNFLFGIGGKINSHLKVHYQYSSYDINRSEWFTKWSEDVGFRASYFLAPITLSFETWFGLNNLANGPLAGATVHQNHFSFLIGYTI